MLQVIKGGGASPEVTLCEHTRVWHRCTRGDPIFAIVWSQSWKCDGRSGYIRHADAAPATEHCELSPLQEGVVQSHPSQFIRVINEAALLLPLSKSIHLCDHEYVWRLCA